MSRTDLATHDSEVLAQRAASADHGAFAELYRRHGPIVYGLCVRMTGDRDDAEELAQGIFVRAWEQLGRFQGGNFEAWLYTLAKHFVLNDRRTRARLRKRVQFDNDAESFASHPVVISQETQLTMDEAIEGLPTARRTVFIMHDIEGYHTNEIASFLHIAASTVRVHLSHARRAIARLLLP